MIANLIAFFLSFPIFSVAVFLCLTMSEDRIRINNRINGWNTEVISFPFTTFIPPYKLHGSEDNP